MKGRVLGSCTATLGALVLLTACPQSGDANVKCGALQSYESRIGTINTPHFALGSIVLLNTTNKSGSFLTSAVPTDAQKITSPAVASESDAFSSGVTVSFSADVPVGVQAQLQTQLENDSSIVGTNVKRVSVSDPLSLVNGNDAAKASIKSTTGGHTDLAVMLVSTITYADSLSISLKNAVSSSANVQTVTYGNYKLNVTYQCSDTLAQSGSQFGAFFKPTFLRYDAATNQVAIDTSANIDLSSYNLNQAVRL